MLAGGESSRLPGPVPKPFRLLAGRPVVARIVDACTRVPGVDQVDVVIRREHERWALPATFGWCECDLLPRGTRSPAERILEERQREEELLVVNGDTVVANHAGALHALTAAPLGHDAARMLTAPWDADIWVDAGGVIERRQFIAVIDVGSYYLPQGYPLIAPFEPPDRVEDLLFASGPVQSVQLDAAVRWYDIGTPEGFAAAELALTTPERLQDWRGG